VAKYKRSATYAVYVSKQSDLMKSHLAPCGLWDDCVSIGVVAHYTVLSCLSSYFMVCVDLKFTRLDARPLLEDNRDVPGVPGAADMPAYVTTRFFLHT
jgi:hypothetical protein